MKNLQVFEELTGINENRIKSYIIASTRSTQTDTDKYLLFVRMSEKFDNSLSDFCFYYDVKNDLLLCMKCSTKAGLYYVYNPITFGGITGTGVLKEGFYKDSHTVIGTYRFGIYDYELLQTQSVNFYRDGNKDDKIDRGKIYSGIVGIDVHTAGFRNIVDNWSSACLVIYRPEWLWFKDRYLKLGTVFSIELKNIREFV
jgi:hypothetical protein